MTKKRKRPAPAPLTDAAILRVAHAAGLNVGPARLTATLPRSRCTPAERKRADELAEAAGISLGELIRKRVLE